MMEERRTGMSVAQILRMVLLLIFLAVAGWLLYTIRGTLFPFAVAFIISYVLMPLVDRMEARGLNRMIGVLVIYASTLGTFVALFILVVPILLKGLDDMKDRIVGETSTWSCVILNRNNAPIKFDRVSVKSSDPQFVVVTPPDKEIPPGVQDTLLVEFMPGSTDPWFGRVDLFGKLNEEEVGPIRLYLTGNFQKQAAQASWEPNYRLVLGSARFGLSSSTHQFGQVMPGYVDQVKSQIEEMQPRLENAIPMLKGMDLAGSINRKVQSTATEVLKETPALLGGLISGLTFVIIVPFVVFFLLSEGRAIKRAFVEVVPNRYFEMVLNLLYRIDLQLGGYIRGLRSFCRPDLVFFDRRTQNHRSTRFPRRRDDRRHIERDSIFGSYHRHSGRHYCGAYPVFHTEFRYRPAGRRGVPRRADSGQCLRSPRCGCPERQSPPTRRDLCRARRESVVWCCGNDPGRTDNCGDQGFSSDSL